MVDAAHQRNGSGLLALTPSKIREYQTCPQQYKLKKQISCGRSAVSPAISFGNSIHAALEEIYTGAPHEDRPVDCAQVLRRHWNSDGYSDPREANSYFNRGQDALRRYMDNMGRPKGRIIATEVFLSRTVRFNGSRAKLGCKIDRLELHGDGVLEVLDYKTNALGKVPTKESLVVDLATFIYYLLARIVYPQHRHVIVSQLNVLTLAKVEVDYTGAELAFNKEALIALVHKMEADNFEPQPSNGCAWCPVRDECPAFAGEADLDNVI